MPEADRHTRPSRPRAGALLAGRSSPTGFHAATAQDVDTGVGQRSVKAHHAGPEWRAGLEAVPDGRGTQTPRRESAVSGSGAALQQGVELRRQTGGELGRSRPDRDDGKVPIAEHAPTPGAPENQDRRAGKPLISRSSSRS